MDLGEKKQKRFPIFRKTIVQYSQLIIDDFWSKKINKIKGTLFQWVLPISAQFPHYKKGGGQEYNISRCRRIWGCRRRDFGGEGGKKTPVMRQMESWGLACHSAGRVGIETVPVLTSYYHSAIRLINCNTAWRKQGGTTAREVEEREGRGWI